MGLGALMSLQPWKRIWPLVETQRGQTGGRKVHNTTAQRPRGWEEGVQSPLRVAPLGVWR